MIVLYSLLFLLSFPVILFGIITVIKPFWIIKSRKYAGLVILGGFILFIGSMIGAFSSIPEDISNPPKAEAEKEAKKEEEPEEEKPKEEETKEKKPKEDKIEPPKEKKKPKKQDATIYAKQYEARYDELWEQYRIARNNPAQWPIWSAQFNREGRTLGDEIKSEFTAPHAVLGLPGAEFILWSEMNAMIEGRGNEKMLKDMDEQLKDFIQRTKEDSK